MPIYLIMHELLMQGLMTALWPVLHGYLYSVICIYPCRICLYTLNVFTRTIKLLSLQNTTLPHARVAFVGRNTLAHWHHCLVSQSTIPYEVFCIFIPNLLRVSHANCVFCVCNGFTVSE
jgi:hypothetical protein